MSTGDREAMYRGYNFLVQIGGITRACFRECSGLESTQDPIDYREGGEARTVRKSPDLVKSASISLKRGVTNDAELWEWRKKVIDGVVQRKSVSIVLLDDTGEEKRRWNLRGGWPTKWTGPSFNATGNDVAIETLEIAHEGLEKA